MDRVRGFVTVALVVILFVGLVFVTQIPGLLVDESVAVRALETQGFSDIQITARHWIAPEYQGCSEDDDVKFDAIATNSAGRRVELYVCAGWLFKGATVRTSLKGEILWI